MKRLTIVDVAERAGVSPGTVSNALNHPEVVADETRETIFSVMSEIGFVRNAAGRQLKGLGSQAVGLVVLDLQNPFYAEVYRGVESTTNAAGVLVVVCGFDGDAGNERRQLRLLEEQRVAGILATRVSRRSARIYAEMRKRGMPIVELDRRGSRRDQCSVSVDDKAGGKLAAEHLIELGHRRIALLNGPREWNQCADRRQGFLAALGVAGLRLRVADDIELEELTIAAGEAAARRLRAGTSIPSAIFCGNDLLALGLEHVLIDAGLRVPEDIAIIGYDDVPFASMANVPITSIRQPAYEIGRRGAAMLLEEAGGGPHRHDRVVLSPELVVRESTSG